MLVHVLCAAFIGCTRTTWETRGQYSATLHEEDGTTRPISTVVYASEHYSSHDPIRLCDVRSVTWGLPGTFLVGEKSALVTGLSRALCQADSVRPDSVAGGYMIVVGHAGSDTTVTTGVRSSEWTPHGALVIAGYQKFEVAPRLDADVLLERVTGTFSVGARKLDGKSMSLENGTFEITVVARKTHYNPFD